MLCDGENHQHDNAISPNGERKAAQWDNLKKGI